MLKYTVKLILWKHETNGSGHHPIYIKITINRQTRYISTGHYLASSHWDKKSELIKENHPLANDLNADITSRKQKIIHFLANCQLSSTTVTAQQVKKQFSRVEEGKPKTNIFNFVDSFISEVKNKRSASTLENYRKHLLRLELFCGNKQLCFEDITTDFLHRYENHLHETVGTNYIHALWKTLRTFFNAAIKKKFITHYPFDMYENPVYIKPDKDYLNRNELLLLEKFTDETKDPVLKECAIYILFGCYSGLRISDWYLFDHDKHIIGNKIRLRPKKGMKKKNKWVEMIISKPLKRNLARMKTMRIKLKEPTINEKLKVIADKIGVKKYVTSHTGRHTFAVTICLDNGVSSETAAELMGITLATFVNNYSQVTQQKIDKETEKAWRGLK